MNDLDILLMARGKLKSAGVLTLTPQQHRSLAELVYYQNALSASLTLQAFN
jgi:hypothetical protein